MGDEQQEDPKLDSAKSLRRQKDELVSGKLEPAKPPKSLRDFIAERTAQEKDSDEVPPAKE